MEEVEGGVAGEGIGDDAGKPLGLACAGEEPSIGYYNDGGFTVYCYFILRQ